MTTPAWPSTLPEFVQEAGYSETLSDRSLESNLDGGPSQARRIHTHRFQPFDVTVWMSDAQMAVFEAFFDGDLAGGALSFNWTHPRTAAAQRFRFRKPWQLSAVADGLYAIKLTLVALP